MSDSHLNEMNLVEDDDDVPLSIEETQEIFGASISVEPTHQAPDVIVSVEVTDETSDVPRLVQNETLENVQRRTFSHWPHSSPEFRAQMIQAGFYGCNVGDRVICIDCNLVCQDWRPHIDDPSDVHRTLSPNCRYVQSKLNHLRLALSPPPPPPPPAPPVINMNLSSTVDVAGPSTNIAPATNHLQHHEIVLKAPRHPRYAGIPERIASFANWPHTNLPSVDDLVRAGFFYRGQKDIVTCFFCNGSIQNWGANIDPTSVHGRWFPHCGYARQLYNNAQRLHGGNRQLHDNLLFSRIRECQRRREERQRTNEGEQTNYGNTSNTNSVTINRQLLISNETNLNLPRFVAARLDLPVTQRLLNQNFNLRIIKRCWEDQLRLKSEDFVSECDLYVACRILQKQIETIDGKRENIVTPSVKMRQIRGEISQRTASTTRTSGSSANSQPSNPCVLCLTEEKRMACIPCGHLATCVPCGKSLRSCPICQREIDAFVRIYI